VRSWTGKNVQMITAFWSTAWTATHLDVKSGQIRDRVRNSDNSASRMTSYFFGTGSKFGTVPNNLGRMVTLYCTPGWLPPNLHCSNSTTEIQRKWNGYSQIYQFLFQIFPFPFCFRFFPFFGLVVWLSGNALVAINEVTLRQARLILGWVHHLGM